MFTKLKVCTECKLEKDVSLFYRRNHPVTKFRSVCKQCHDGATYLYVDNNRDKLLRSWRESSWRKQGIDIERAYKLLALCKCCAICGNKDVLYPDHCHEKKFLRGVLCRNCNFGLGHFKDSIKFLLKACVYLIKSRLTFN